MFQNWLKIAFVNYKKNALSTIVNLLGLTLGLMAFMLIILQWVDEEEYEDWNPNKDRIYLSQMYFDSQLGYWNTISYPMAYEASKRIEGIEDFVLINNYSNTIKLDYSSKSFFSDYNFNVSENYFKYFPYKLKFGSYHNIFKNKNDIAISSKVSEALFGHINPVGKSLKLEMGTFLIKAVYTLPEANTDMDPSCVFYCKDIEENKENWSNFNFNCFFILKPNANPKQIQKEMFDKVLLLRAKEDPSLSPMEYIHLYGPSKVLLTRLDQMKLYAENSPYGSSSLKIILILFSLAVLLLMLTGINFTNLKTAEASQRAKEVGVRKALGATRFQLVQQLLIETALIGILTTFLSLVLVELILPFFNVYFKKDITHIPSSIYWYALLVLLVIVLLSGIIPALYIANFKAVDTLKGNFSRSKKGIILRNFILGLQLIISSFFIIGGLIVNKQVNFMMDKDLGFKGSQIYLIRFSKSDNRGWLKYERAKSELLKIKGVEDISYGEASPNGGHTGSSNVDFGKQNVQSIHGAMDYDFLPFMGVKLKAGRWLSPKLASDTINSFIINEAFVKKMGWTNTQSIGKQVQPGFSDKKFNIVGVVADYNLFGVDQKCYPITFFHYKAVEWKKESVWNIQVKINKDDIVGTLERIQKFWETKMEPSYPIDAYFVDKRFALTFEQFEKLRTLFGILNILVLVIALLGLFALSSLLIEQKLKEVAIRKTLGASASDLVFELTKRFVIITLISVLLSYPIVYYFMNEWLKEFAYRIDMPWLPFVISLFSLILLTIAVVSIKAFRATQINLINYLKYE